MALRLQILEPMKYVLPFAVLCATAACSDPSPPIQTGHYEHWLSAPEDCPDDPLFNCAPSIQLCSDGTAVMLVTDIINGGTFTENGDTVTATFAAGDVPETIVFTFGDRTLTDDWLDWEWTLNPATALIDCQ